MESPAPYTPVRLSWPRKFAAAFRGCYLGTRGQSSFLVHGPAAASVVVAAACFRVEPLEWCVLALSIAGVIAAELANSAVESLAKAIVTRADPHIAEALDIASGAVLVAAAGAVVSGCVIFGPRFWTLVGG